MARPAGSVLRATSGEGLCAAAVTLPDAAALGRDAFERRVKDLYIAVLLPLLRDGYHPLRFWNFIPGINDALEPGLSRYMGFNAARYAAYRAVYGAVDGALPGAIATASAVGAPDSRFHLYCLATRHPVVPLENPRQVPAYEYSNRYGPLPPCFARGMLVRAPSPLLVIGGTASVRGEASVHQSDLSAQLNETLLNVGLLIRTGCLAAGRQVQAEPLRDLVSLRAYVVNEASAGPVGERLAAACGLPASAIELRVADLCRPDLLVEVEGVAALGGVAGASVWAAV